MSAAQRAAIEGDETEKTFTFSSETEAGAGGDGGERKETPQEFLARQQREAEEAEGEEDRGDNFEPDEEVQPAEIPGNLEDIQKLLGEDPEQQPAKPAAAAAQIMIPKTRFDEVNGKMKDAVARAEAAERQLAELAAKPAEPAVEFDFRAAELRYIHALTEEGDQEKALEIREEIRTAEKALYKAQSNGSVSEVNAQATAQDAFMEVVASAIDLYPFLDSTKPETMNEKAIKMVVALRKEYEAEGKTSASALNLAVSEVCPMFSKTEPEPQPQPKAKTQAELRAEEALRRNATAAAQQPAHIGRLGEQAGKTTRSIQEMSEKEFDALPDEEKRRLRGDEV